MYDFEVAKDKVLMGVERKSLLLSDEEKKNTAYHEAGHALVAAMLPHSDPVHKVTIIPRAWLSALTMQLRRRSPQLLQELSRNAGRHPGWRAHCEEIS